MRRSEWIAAALLTLGYTALMGHVMDCAPYRLLQGSRPAQVLAVGACVEGHRSGRWDVTVSGCDALVRAEPGDPAEWRWITWADPGELTRGDTVHLTPGRSYVSSREFHEYAAVGTVLTLLMPAWLGVLAVRDLRARAALRRRRRDGTGLD